jgi:hypothetical protein
VTIGAETQSSFRTVSSWTHRRVRPYPVGMKRKKPEMSRMIERVVPTAAAAGPVGWMALVTCAALALAAYAISAMLTVVHALKG